MSASPSSRKSGRSSNPNGVKMLVTAASVAAVVGGWAVFSVEQSKTANLASNSDTNNSADATTNQVALDLPPLPTLVPIPSTVASSSVKSAIANVLPASVVSTPQPNSLLAPTPGAVTKVKDLSSKGNSSSSGGGKKSGGGGGRSGGGGGGGGGGGAGKSHSSR
jgi:hypothetical protein